MFLILLLLMENFLFYLFQHSRRHRDFGAGSVDITTNSITTTTTTPTIESIVEFTHNDENLTSLLSVEQSAKRSEFYFYFIFIFLYLIA